MALIQDERKTENTMREEKNQRSLNRRKKTKAAKERHPML